VLLVSPCSDLSGPPGASLRPGTGRPQLGAHGGMTFTPRSRLKLAAVGGRILCSRPLMRAPIWFFKVHAGAVLGPRVRVYAGSRAPKPATARIMTQQEADRALGAYANRHPRAWQRFKLVLEHTLGSPITETDTPLPIVELRLG
jgi:hypothetical protein